MTQVGAATTFGSLLCSVGKGGAVLLHLLVAQVNFGCCARHLVPFSIGSAAVATYSFQARAQTPIPKEEDWLW